MTHKPVFLRARANADIDEALDFYLVEAPEEVEALLESLRDTVERIGRSPGVGSPRYSHELDMPGLRHISTPRFPYLVFYFDTDQRVEVIRVLHQRRDLPDELDAE
ncbi:MAG: type II toxin-antitoxin system RelE/ParE family toxin [Deltaproteobacteria bacterium]|nr:type II toxin-antitoxin system RelE/ParE family toxin [Deltaproteobacteria bacterium]